MAICSTGEQEGEPGAEHDRAQQRVTLLTGSPDAEQQVRVRVRAGDSDQGRT